MDCDADFAFLYGYHGVGDLIRVNIKKLIPALVLPTGETLNKVSTCTDTDSCTAVSPLDHSFAPSPPP